MLNSNRNSILVTLFVAASLAATGRGADKQAPLKTLDVLARIQTTRIDRQVTRRAVANPTNQKVVSNEQGIFVTYLCTSTQGDQQNRWRLMQSTDVGQTFRVLHEEVSATKAPTLDTDADGNLYLCRPDYATRGPKPQGWFYRFSASNNYAAPLRVPVPRLMAGKFAAAWDESRRQMLFWVHSGWFSVLSPDGQSRHLERIVVHGPAAYLQYPLLCMSRDHKLYAGWTTWERGMPTDRKSVYWDIHVMRSADGGKSWEKLDGTRLQLPQAADNSGETDRITRDDEFENNTWLAAMLPKDGKLHFVYKTRAFEVVANQSGAPSRQHYVRLDMSNGEKDVDIFPVFRGQQLAIRGPHCLLSADSTVSDGPLYCVGYEAPWMSRCRLICLASDDNGKTWYDYAHSLATFMPTGVGGCRQLSDDGFVIGTFTDLVDTADSNDLDMFDTRHSIYFFKIRAGLAKADAKRRDTRVQFSNVRGQPVWIRFRQERGSWSAWTAFQAEMNLPLLTAAKFQLKSRLGIVSDEYTLPSQ